MTRLNLDKLHVENQIDDKKTVPRKYTLTHSDITGDLYLTIASEFNHNQISGLYTRIMRDEILAEWINSEEGLTLHVYCHVGGGIIFGNSSMRESIFRREMPLVLEAICNGDSKFYEKNHALVNSHIFIHFQKSGIDYKIEKMGTPLEYLMTTDKM